MEARSGSHLRSASARPTCQPSAPTATPSPESLIKPSRRGPSVTPPDLSLTPSAHQSRAGVFSSSLSPPSRSLLSCSFLSPPLSHLLLSFLFSHRCRVDFSSISLHFSILPLSVCLFSIVSLLFYSPSLLFLSFFQPLSLSHVTYLSRCTGLRHRQSSVSSCSLLTNIS